MVWAIPDEQIVFLNIGSGMTELLQQVASVLSELSCFLRKSYQLMVRVIPLS